MEKENLFPAWFEGQLKEKGLTLQQVAERSGDTPRERASYQSLWDVLHGRRKVGANLGPKIARGLGVPTSAVLVAAGRMETIDPRTQEEIEILEDLQQLDPHYLSLVKDFIASLTRRRPPMEERPARKDKRGQVSG